jgi:hypothetical protein
MVWAIWEVLTATIKAAETMTATAMAMVTTTLLPCRSVSCAIACTIP